jgi:SSS family solute:Na+ symporter
VNLERLAERLVATGRIDPAALTVFLFFFALVAVMGFIAARWRKPETLAHLDEWGLGGRQFGVWITWFLLGGDLYTAYTMIAVPALLYGAGAYGFFAVPYTVIMYPLVFVVMPRLWDVARRAGYVTAGDVVHGRYDSHALELAVAITGVVATMPYIALQLVGMRVAFAALGLPPEISLFLAFSVLGLFTYSSGLRAPALIAFVKDAMIYIVVIAAVVVIPRRLGGYGHIFEAAETALKARGSVDGLLVAPSNTLLYSSLALGSSLALFMYPHSLTGIFAARSGETIKRNAILLPLYSLALGLLALMGYMALAAGINVSNSSEAVPALIAWAYPGWFAGFAYASIAIGALVPAAMMSIGAANLFTRNFWKAYVDPMATPAQEARVAKITSSVVKVGALGCILFLPLQFALDLQLLGGIWIMQTFPAVVFGLFTNFFKAPALLLGWMAGFGFGTYAFFVLDRFNPAHEVVTGYPIYTGLLAFAANVVVALVLSAVLPAQAPRQARA